MCKNMTITDMNILCQAANGLDLYCICIPANRDITLMDESIECVTECKFSPIGSSSQYVAAYQGVQISPSLSVSLYGSKFLFSSQLWETPQIIFQSLNHWLIIHLEKISRRSITVFFL